MLSLQMVHPEKCGSGKRENLYDLCHFNVFLTRTSYMCSYQHRALAVGKTFAFFTASHIPTGNILYP